MMYYKIYERRFGVLIAVCDLDLCGKTLKKGDIDFHINPRFYKDKEGDRDKIIELLKESVNYNLVGKEAVQCGIDAGVINPENVIKIEDVPHAQGLLMNL